MDNRTLEIIYQNQPLQIGYFLRPGEKGSVLYIHGLGCSKNDFSDAVTSDYFKDYTLAAFDFPGCGSSPYPESAVFTIDDLVEITEAMAAKLTLQEPFIIGHSMGGLVALLFIEKHANMAKGFVNIEGNLAPTDCFFSREASQCSFSEFEKTVFSNFKRRLSGTKNRGLEQYADSLERSSPKAFFDICPSLVDYSDNGNLLQRFVRLSIPKLFVYGEENRDLSYLPDLKTECEVIEIKKSGHFPFYDNPKGFYTALSDFMNR
jgi:pimeloyl-ACP methyl ester carboxylesterase